MLRHLFGLILVSGLIVTSSSSQLYAAPQSMGELQKALGEIESAGMPEEQKQKAREQIMRQMKKAGGKVEKPESKKKEGGDDKKKKDGDKKEGDKKKDESSTTVKRPEEPKEPADPKELEARPTNGKLVLQFRGQPWPAMIDWFSRATERDVEWQELPKGFVNLRTQQALTMDQTGDRLNRLLLGLGFTMLDDGQFLQIVKTEGLNPAFVPRVAPQKLATMMPYAFARTSFQLNRFKAEEIVKELEAMKSKHGKLTAMTAANRIEAMDTVINLRDIYDALDQEQSSGHHKPQEFVIKFVRAEVVRDKLAEMLGLPKTGSDSKGSSSSNPQQQQMERMRREQERQRQQQQQKKGGQPSGQPAPEKISMIVNDVKNSIIVKAPPYRMLDISDAIELLDVRIDGQLQQIQSYTLATRDPQELADLLEESGTLSPTAMIRVDSKSKTLLISGSQFDHYRVGELIKSIDGNARRFVSHQLRKYPAAQVAGTIEKMMGAPKEDNSRSRYRWWDDGGDDDDASDKFQVTADVENNRLILKCNDAEYEMVMELLTQMGEVMTRSKFAMNEVVLDEFGTSDVSENELLERIKKAFESYAPNEVVLPPPKPKTESEEKEEPDTESPDDTGGAVDINSRTTNTTRPSTYRTLLTQVEVDSTTPSNNGDLPRYAKPADRKSGTNGASATKTPPPIVIERNAQGRLVIRSKDPAALEMFEGLVQQMAPGREDWVPFRLEHVSAFWMKTQLEDFFEDDKGGPSYVFWDYWDYERSQDNKSAPGLGDAPKMRFIDDGERTLVVRNASAKQLAKVKQLIELYDISEPANPNDAYFQKMIHIKHSKAKLIEVTLKDAFRDLLSSKDKAFGEKGNEEERGGSRRFSFGFGFGSDDSSSGLGSGSTFKGKLSFGVHEATNRLIVIAKGKNLLNLVIEMVEELDKASIPTDDTRVMTLPAGLNSNALKETLAKMFGPESIQSKPPQPQQGEGEGKGGEGREGGGRGRGKGRDR